MKPLSELTVALVGISSISGNEDQIASFVYDKLVKCPWLDVLRIENNVVARTNFGRKHRIILAGHLDTVPPSPPTTPLSSDDNTGADSARVDNREIYGLGVVDAKGGIAIMINLATEEQTPSVDVTYIFYACEEIGREYNGLHNMLSAYPDLFAGDAAILTEPTGGIVEAGCQGTLQIFLSMRGKRAHTARPSKGVNAIHRAGEVIGLINAYKPRICVLDGCQYTEALQVVNIQGGIAGNVVPDLVTLAINHRFAPDKNSKQALEFLEGFLEPAMDTSFGDRIEVVDLAEPAPPNLANSLLSDVVAVSGAKPRAKLGWTDVATFHSIGIPACNLGPGDPELAHSGKEHLPIKDLDKTNSLFKSLLNS